MNKVCKFVAVIICLILLMTPVSIATDSIYVWSSDQQQTITTSVLPEQEGNFLNLESGAGILIEQNSGKILYSHNEHEKLRPASVTKVMTLLLIMEALDSGRISLTDKIPCSENASKMGGSQIWLDVKETLTVDEMLKAICIVSANDCTVAMAEYLAGSQQAFVEQMNQKAKQLGMNDTTFINCHGLDEDGHLTSAYDIALMSRELLKKHPTITKYTTIWMDSLRNGESQLVNTNKLLRNYNGITGLKTGSTGLALYNLSASATRDGLSLIAVVMKAENPKIRFGEAQKLLDYGFSNYTYKEFGKRGETVGTILVNKGIQNTVEAIWEEPANVLMKKGQESNVVQDIQLEKNITAPVENGQKVGEAIYTLNGEEIARVNIIAKNEVKKTSLFNITTGLYKSWFNLIRKVCVNGSKASDAHMCKLLAQPKVT